MIRVLAPGLRSTVQDGGRAGHLRAAIPPSGPADPYAHAAANSLVGNETSAACVEIVGGPFRFACDDARLVAVAGPDVSVRGRDRLPGWLALLARPGAELTVELGPGTRYAYLAVSGGIALPEVLGSRSTHLAAGLGPLPRALRAGDALPLGGARPDLRRAGTSAPAPDYAGPVRVMRGPHEDRFESGAVEAFLGAEHRVAESDRMGARLEASPVRPRQGELLTCGVLAGAIQVPSGGAPIVLLADHQTTGGYAVIATVIGADLGIVAQRPSGAALSFYEVRRDEALAALRDRRLAPAVRD